MRTRDLAKQMPDVTIIYTFQKFVMSQQNTNKHDNILKDIRYFLDNKPSRHPKVSHIHYMEPVNKNPDSDETMTLISEDLVDKLGPNIQDGWVVIVGDSKTYEHLMNIKQNYTSTFQKVLIFQVIGTFKNISNQC